MRLDAVYLVAPKPKPPSVPTRRAFLVAGATFCAGLGLGGACGYAVGVGKGGDPPGEVTAEPPMESSGDALLDELRRLATKAPIEELMEKRDDFIGLLYQTYPNDSISWQGVDRLVNALLTDTNFPNRRIFARWLAQGIESADRDIVIKARKQLDQLRSIK